jgi:hypothetical protein
MLKSIAGRGFALLAALTLVTAAVPARADGFTAQQRAEIVEVVPCWRR